MRDRRQFLRDSGLAAGLPALGLGSLAIGETFAGDAAEGAFCPHPHPIVHENRCTDPATFTASFQVKTSWSMITGWARRSSVDVGEPVDLVISGPNLWLDEAPEPPLESVEVEVFRLGYYGGKGGRRVWKSPAGISTWQRLDAGGRPSNTGTRPAQHPSDAQTGLTGWAKDRTIVRVPGSALQTSGVYLAKLKGRWYEFPPGTPAFERTGESHVVWIVRDDGRPRELLVMLPTNTWQAYNYAESRSLYTVLSRFGHGGSIVPATGTERAAKASLDRPYNNWGGETNWVLRTEFPAIWWFERHGFDVAYTDDVAVHFDPEQLQPEHSKALAILGHGEYWTQEMRDGVEAARDAGTSIFNFGANTGYWRVRYETQSGQPATSQVDARVMACFKVIEGGGSPQPTVTGKNDPVAPTTTFRDPGKGPGVAVPGTTAATPPSYAGNGRPESALFGVQYIGDDDNRYVGLTVPADNGEGEFAGHRAWRHTAVPAAGATLGTGLVGWEWDGVPAPGQPFAARPVTQEGGELRRLSETDPRIGALPSSHLSYLCDAGRTYSPGGAGANPPAGWTPYAHAVTYRAPSGALVFSAGTIHWSWGLGPHYLHQNQTQTYVDPAVDSTHPAISQATCNLLADAEVFPLTPEGLVVETPEPDPTTPDPTTLDPTTPDPTTPDPTTPDPTTPDPTPPDPTTPDPTTPDPTTPVDQDPDPGPEPEPEPEPEPTTPEPPLAEPTPPRVEPPRTDPPSQPEPPRPPEVVPALPRLRVTLLTPVLPRSGAVKVRVVTDGAPLARLEGRVELWVGKQRIARGTFGMTNKVSVDVKLRLTTEARRTIARRGALRPLARVIVTKPAGVNNTLARVTIQARRSK